ncbi:hypothetical protein ABZ700_06485, partial [Streptomyces diastaticus]|uniref:hypothetical protein n=1 Tax=Streptomyces diastaticus TaxID=1956 RepID=UPI0034075951
MTGEEPALPTVRLHGRAPQLSRVRAWWHQPPAHRTALLVAGEPVAVAHRGAGARRDPHRRVREAAHGRPAQAD